MRGMTSTGIGNPLPLCVWGASCLFYRTVSDIRTCARAIREISS